jgi:homoserine O-acetyltransferase/O-succinyltransferase
MRAGGIFANDCGRCVGMAMVFAVAVVVASSARADPQIFSLYDFTFEDGTVMPELRIVYETQGTLAPNRDNAIVLLHETLGDRHGFDDQIGPGKIFDTSRFFVITADAIGGGESSSPGDGSGQDFPRYTIRDAMEMEYALVSRGLGLARLRAIVGRSMGAFIGLEWAVHHPEMPQRLALLAPTARSDANFQVIIDLMTEAIALDPDWNGGRYARNPVEGLRHAGMTYYPWSVTASYLDRIPSAQLAQESETAAKESADWDANSLVLRLAACRGHDVAAPFDSSIEAALAHATMPILLLPSASDRMIGLVGAQRLRDALPHAGYVEIPGDLGHRAIAAPAGSPEATLIEHALRDFLK